MGSADGSLAEAGNAGAGPKSGGGIRPRAIMLRVSSAWDGKCNLID